MSSADLTRRALTFGAQDSTTGWFDRDYAESIIQGSIQPQGASLQNLPCGSYAKYPNTLFTPDVIHEGDQIEDAFGDIYEVNTVVRWSRLNEDSHAVCELIKKQLDQRDATSGSWHLDADSLTTDQRSRTKVWLDTYLSLLCTHVTQFDGADYPIKYLFNAELGVDADIVFSIGKEPSTPLLDYNHVAYAFNEAVTINLYAVNKTGVTATNLIEEAEQDIRDIATDHGIVEGRSIRNIKTTKHSPVDLGDRTYLWNTTITSVSYTHLTLPTNREV